MPNRKVIFFGGLATASIILAGFYMWNLNRAVQGFVVDAEASAAKIVAPAVSVPAQPMPASVLIPVTFTSQAPFANWKDLRQETGCEEAAVIMAMHWATGEILTPVKALHDIRAIADYELKHYGYYADTSAKDTMDIIFKEYFKYDNVALKYGIRIDDIKKELAKGHLALIPANGQALHNPHFTPPGPPHHMLLVTGYDDATQEFITNDPGTRAGENFRYSYATIASALQDYESGNDAPLKENRTAMIVVAKPGPEL